MTSPTYIDVLRIPADGSRLKIYTREAVKYANEELKILDTKTVGLEESLGHVPDLTKWDSHINLSRRCLFNKDPSNYAAGEEWDQDYYMYKCIDTTEQDLPENKYFKGLKNSRVYGDAFVFRVKEVRTSHGESMAVFGDMKDFKRSFSDWYYFCATAKAMAMW